MCGQDMLEPLICVAAGFGAGDSIRVLAAAGSDIESQGVFVRGVRVGLRPRLCARVCEMQRGVPTVRLATFAFGQLDGRQGDLRQTLSHTLCPEMIARQLLTGLGR